MRRARRLIFTTLTVAAAPALAQEIRVPLELRPLATWQSAVLRESSGLAASHRYPGILWTHNDSGDGPVLYATDTLGVLQAAFEVVGARAVDWEAVTLGTCPVAVWTDRTCLYIADTGDNNARRTRVVVYAVPEPDPYTVPQGSVGQTERARALRLRYIDGPHDAEALVLLPGGELALLTKGRSRPVLRLAIPANAWQSSDFDLAAPDTLPIEPQAVRGRWVTDAALAPGGHHVVVRTYTEVYRFRVGPRWQLDGPVCQIGFVEPQGEGITFLDGERMVLGSESVRGRAGGLTLVRCPWE